MVWASLLLQERFACISGRFARPTSDPQDLRLGSFCTLHRVLQFLNCRLQNTALLREPLLAVSHRCHFRTSPGLDWSFIPEWESLPKRGVGHSSLVEPLLHIYAPTYNSLHTTDGSLRHCA